MSKKWNDYLDKGINTLVIALDIAGAFDSVWHQGLISKLSALGISGNLLGLFSNYLNGRSLQVVVNGHTSSSYPVAASVPQGSVLGPILWNVYLNDLLHCMPSVHAYADDCTLTHSFTRANVEEVIQDINQQLQFLQSWGRRWQVTFAPAKTHAMVITRSPTDLNALDGRLKFNDKTLEIKSSINILGVEIDHRLTFESHIKTVAHKASLKVTMLRRMRKLLDSKGLVTLYKAQIRSHLEYACLAWMASPRTHLALLDKVQRRAERIIANACRQGEEINALESLHHRRNVAALTVLHKAQVQRVPHLVPLGLPWRQPQRVTRAALQSDCLVQVPRSHTSLHQRTFVAATAHLWNAMTTQMDVRQLSTQKMKQAANCWCHSNFVT